MNIDLILAQAVTAVLVSWWKMVLMLPPFFAWAWLISSVLDKDARYFHLNHRMWNGIHLGAGVAALAAMLFIPIFWIGWPVGVLLLLAPLLAYWQIRDKAVPETQRFKITGEGFGAKMAARAQKKAALQALLQFTDAGGE